MEEYHILNGEHDTLVETDYDNTREIFDDSIDSRDIEVVDDLQVLQHEQDSSSFGKESATAGSGEPAAVVSKRIKYSFVWQYFRSVPHSNQYQCLLCHSCVGNQTSNLARHLSATHDISRQREKNLENLVRIRPRSFIWKYCTKEDSKHARCHLCNKVLYFGGGNTANISKHLRRLHADLIKELAKETSSSSAMDDDTMHATASLNATQYEEDHNGRSSADLTTERKERRGASYVWNYCEKLSRHTIRCKLCTKVMSFHGTANVITHLQRRHNVLGEPGTPLNQVANGKTDLNEVVNDIDNADDEELTEFPNRKMGRKTYSSASVVWKYCTRVSQDQVRCCFCKKNLSYQGTSNLQRHLHRMHGIVTHGRLSKAGGEEFETVKDNQFQLPENIDFIWQFCSQLSGDRRTKCNMCDAVFETKDTETIVRHLAMTHSVETNQPNDAGGGRNVMKTRKRSRVVEFETSDDGNYDDYYDGGGKWSKLDENGDPHLGQEFDETNIKKDESLYDDIIVEDHTNYDEEPFDPSEMPQVNPLSPHTSQGDSPQPQTNADIQYLPQNTSASLNCLPALDVKVLQKLQEDRLRMETEYFREKAGFYRMQKYLTALQAKKVRVEIERMHQEEATVVTTADLNGAYAVEVAIPEHHITTQ